MYTSTTKHELPINKESWRYAPIIIGDLWANLIRSPHLVDRVRGCPVNCDLLRQVEQRHESVARADILDAVENLSVSTWLLVVELRTGE